MVTKGDNGRRGRFAADNRGPAFPRLPRIEEVVEDYIGKLSTTGVDGVICAIVNNY